MKNLFIYGICLFFANTILAQNGAAYGNGNNEEFSLEGALAMFKKANSIEEFEKLINSEENSVNNIDGNSDGEIDYIFVKDLVESNSHSIILYCYIDGVNTTEIATIGIEKIAEDDADIQIIGNESYFGQDAIFEPYESQEIIENKKGPTYPQVTFISVHVNVWFWPCVKFVYAPNYMAYASPFKWKTYPNWWKPWKRVGYPTFRTKCYVHLSHFRKTYTIRVLKKNKSVVVKNRKGTTVIHKGKRGKTTVVKRNRRR